MTRSTTALMTLTLLMVPARPTVASERPLVELGPIIPVGYSESFDPIAPAEPDVVFQPVHGCGAVQPRFCDSCDGCPICCQNARGHYGGGHHGGGHGRRDLADKHGPAGIMGDHVHDCGEWMVEYKYMNMFMDGNRIGHRRVSDGATIPTAPGGFVVDGVRTNNGASPTQMTMEMHMVHLMYGMTDDVTLYTMLTFPSLTMSHIRGPMNPAGRGTPFNTHTSGIGDTTIGALIRVWDDCDEDIILNVAGSLPTGEIHSTSTNPTGGRVAQVLPYPMRLGSGTFNARPGITYKRYYDHGSFGMQYTSDIPIGRNYRDYAVGDTHRFNTWYSHLVSKNLALSVRLENMWRANYDGADPAAANGVISTNVEQFRGGYWMNLGIGSMLLVNGHLFNVEFVPTLYQDVDGIQLGTDWQFVASWSKSF